MERVASDRELRDELRARGLARARDFSWERTAQATREVYRSVAVAPSDRALRMRRLLRDAMIDWSAKAAHPAAGALAPLGIREACRVLQTALRSRLRREVNRMRTMPARSQRLRQ
jgi:hypothetical protein